MTHQQKPGFQIRRLQQSAVAIFLREMTLAGHDLTPVQYAALATVSAHPDLDQASLAAKIALDKATMGGVLDRLVAKGLITRAINPGNRRARILSITNNGQDLLDKSEPVVEAVQHKILAGLTDSERVQFVSLLDKLVEATRDESRIPDL